MVFTLGSQRCGGEYSKDMVSWTKSPSMGRLYLDENSVANLFVNSMACAIREAYAATLTVVILVDGRQEPTDE